MQNGAADTQQEAEMTRLKDELNADEENIQVLEEELKSCRSETLRLRSKSASVALSLEGLKEELQSLLQSEAEIQTTFKPQPSEDGENTEQSTATHQLPSHDHATLCALEGQLEETKRIVEKAVHERDDLLRKMSEEGSIHVGLPEDDYSPRDVSALSFFQKLLKTEEQTEGECVNMDLIQKLNALSTSSSSFRDDHARIWRDSTLPNVALISPSEDTATCGVVSERLFAGLTAYTSTNADGEVAQHCYLSKCGETRPITNEEFDTVKGVYSTLRLEDPSTAPHEIKIIAPRQALERVIQLVNTAANHSIPGAMSPAPSAPTTPTRNLLRNPDARTGPRQHLDASPPSVKRPGPRLSDVSHVLKEEHFRFLVHECIPVRFQESDCQLIYSTNNDGMSVHTLYERAKGVSPTIVAVRDSRGRVFGAYAATAWKESASRYYGTGECFVFSCKPRLAVYKWNRRNHFFQFSHGNILAMGGGAGSGTGSAYALRIDEDLVAGSTSCCTTFDSPPLTCDDTNRADFDIVTLELWTVVPHGATHKAT